MDPVTLLVSSSVTAAVVTGLFLIAQTLFNKRLRTPADKLAEAQFSVKVYQDQVAEARQDKALNDQTIATLREYASKLEADGREDQKLILDLYQQIGALERRNREKDDKIYDLQRRIDRVAAKVARGEPITVQDLDGSPMTREANDSEDLEDTLNKDQIEKLKENNS